MSDTTFSKEEENMSLKEAYEKEKVNIEERVRMLYAQSGGPEKASKRIEELMREHLLHGKDHGRRGTIETYSDAIEQLMIDDRSLKVIRDTVQKWRFMLTTMFHMQNERMNRFLRTLEDHNRIMERKFDVLTEALKEQNRNVQIKETNTD